MTIINEPRISVAIANAALQVGNTAQKVLVVGQSNIGGGDVLHENVSSNDITGIAGAGSMLEVLTKATRKYNGQTRVDSYTLADAPTAVAAAGTIVYPAVGALVETTTFTVVPGGNDHTVYVTMPKDSDLVDVGAAIAAAVNGKAGCPVTAADDGAGTVTFTAKSKGTWGNSLPLKVTNTSSAAVTVATPMSGGSVDPVMTGLVDFLGSTQERYQGIVWPYLEDTATSSALLVLMDQRFNATGHILDGVVFGGALVADVANNLAESINSQSLVIFGDKSESGDYLGGPATAEHPTVVAAQFAGIRALRLDTNGYSLGNLVITANGALDAFGGPALASKPYFNTPFSAIPPIGAIYGFESGDIESLKEDGISVIGNNPAGTQVVTGEIVTTYKTDAGGNEDVTFKYLNYVDTASQAREYFFNNLRKRFGQSRLTTGDIVRGRDMANSKVIRSYLKRLYQELSGPDYVLLEAGEDALQFFMDNLIIDIDKAQGLVTIQMTVPIVTQLRTMNATMKVAFSTVA